MQLISLKKKVRDIMVRGVITVDFNASVREVLDALVKHSIAGVVVVHHREAVGVISTTDILRTVKERTEEEMDSLEANDIMTPIPITCGPEQTIKEAMNIMIEKKIHRLIILSVPPAPQMPVGILSATDIVNELCKEIRDKFKSRQPSFF